LGGVLTEGRVVVRSPGFGVTHGWAEVVGPRVVIKRRSLIIDRFSWKKVKLEGNASLFNDPSGQIEF